MAVYTVSITDGTTLANLAVSAGRGPKGDGWTSVTFDNDTGRFIFTSNDGLGYTSDNITAGFDAAIADAEAARDAAQAAQAATETIFDQFGDQYLGPKASDPTVDNDGDPLTEGDIYFNTTDDVLKFYSGTAWVAPEVIATTAANNAETSATNAATSASAAATSATGASNSASAASTSETNAASSASSAATSAANASTSETNAAGSESAAASSATAASTSASAAATSETNAASSVSSAATSETNASTSASAAATSASNASTSETNAATSASAASTSASNASASASSAAASFDSFDDRYLGSKASAPSTDNDGDALLAGAIYWNTTVDSLFIWDGAAWSAAVFDTNGALFGVNNLSDLTDFATARSNLGLVIGTDVQAFDATLLRSSDLISGTGISISGTTITNAAPDQTVVLTQGANVTVTGTYPNFTIASTDTNTEYTAGTGLVLAGTEFSVGATVVTSAYTGNVDITGEFIADSYNETLRRSQEQRQQLTARQATCSL